MGQTGEALQTDKSLISEKGWGVPVGPASHNYCEILMCFWYSNKNGQGRRRESTTLNSREAGGWPGKAPKATCLPFQRSALPRAAWVQVTVPPQLPEGRLLSRGRRARLGALHAATAAQGQRETIHKPQLFFGKFSLRPIVAQGTFLQLRARLACPGPSTNVCCGLPGMKKQA